MRPYVHRWSRHGETRLADAKIKFSKLTDKVLQNLQNADLELKRLTLYALDIRVYASTDVIEINGKIPLELASPTTVRTLG